METGRAKRAVTMLDGWRAKVALLATVATLSMGLSACGTCVNGDVSIFDMPLPGILVQLLDKNSSVIDIRYTDYRGEYCFEKVRLNEDMTIRAVLDELGNSASAPIHTAGTPGFCKDGPCTRAPDISFSCDLDGLEPNNSCGTASPVTLPYTNTLGTLCPPGDLDFYRFDIAEDGMAIVAQTYYSGFGNSFDSLLGIFDSNCNLLASEDWGGQGRYAKIAYPLPFPGTYYVTVTSSQDWNFQGSHTAFGAYGIDIGITHRSCVNVHVTMLGEPVEGAWVSSGMGPYCQTDSNGDCCFEAYEGLESEFTICHPVTLECVTVATTPQGPGSCTLGGCETLNFDFDYTCVSGAIIRDATPVGGASVCASFWNFSTCTVTSQDGTFCVVATADTNGSVTVQDPMFWYVWKEIPVTTESGGRCDQGGCTEVLLELPGITCVSGTVTRGGYPEQGIWVSGPGGQAQTAQDGTYCLQAPKNSYVCIHLDDPIVGDYRTTCLMTGDTGSCEEGGCTSLDFDLEPAACIHGVISRLGGTPAENVQVCAYPGECVTTDPDGRYCLRARTATYTQVTVYDPATGQGRYETLVTDGEGSCVPGTCTEFNMDDLPPAACASGVVSRAGVPQRAVTVCASPGGCGSTDSEGYYCLPIPADSYYYLWTYDPVLHDSYSAHGLPAPVGSCSEGNCADHNFAFTPTTCISGVVREGTAPLQGATVSNETGSVVTDENGYYCLPARANTSGWIRAVHPLDGSEITRYPKTGAGGSCEQGGCTTQNFTFDVKRVSPH
jgi:hypothetical protein